MVHSQRKGQVAERYIAKALSDWTGLKFRRSGLGKTGDDLEVVGGSFPWSVEVKNHAKLKMIHLFTAPQLLQDFFQQAVEQASTRNKMPLLTVKVDSHWWAIESVLHAKTHDCQAYLKNKLGAYTVIIRPFDQFLYDYDHEK